MAKSSVTGSWPGIDTVTPSDSSQLPSSGLSSANPVGAPGNSSPTPVTRGQPGRSTLSSDGLASADGEASRFIERVLTRGYRDHHVAYSLGAAYAQLGDPAAAHRWLRTAADTGFPCLPFFERDPLLEPLRRRADFSQLLQHVRDRRALVQAAGTHR